MLNKSAWADVADLQLLNSGPDVKRASYLRNIGPTQWLMSMSLTQKSLFSGEYFEIVKMDYSRAAYSNSLFTIPQRAEWVN